MTLRVDDLVSKITGDYRFDGTVRAVFPKASGEVRIVVEDDRGILFIARPDQYRKRNGKPIERAQCPKGHAYEGDNIILGNDLRRRCRACDIERKRAKAKR